MSMGILQAKNPLVWVASLSPGDLPNPGIEIRSPALQVDSLPSEPPGKPVLSILQYILTKVKGSFKRSRDIFAVKSTVLNVLTLCHHKDNTQFIKLII